MKTKHHSILSASVIQSGAKTLNNTIDRRRFSFALCGLLFASLLALSPSQVRAGCQQWDVSGNWYIKQSNGFTVHLNLTQHGTRINGSGKTSTAGRHGLHGNIIGDDFYVEITWGPDAQGVYRGKVGSSGRIDGTTYDAQNPGSTAKWFSDRAMNCADAAPVEPNANAAAPAKPKSSGKMPKPSETAPNPH